MDHGERLEVPTARHGARERALQLLYEAECKEIPMSELLESLPVAPDSFAAWLASGTDANREDLDRRLSDLSPNWPLQRMPALDRAVLRLGAFELISHPQASTAVILDEAVQLAKEYSTDDSSRFVNGVLAAVAQQVRA